LIWSDVGLSEHTRATDTTASTVTTLQVEAKKSEVRNESRSALQHVAEEHPQKDGPNPE